MAWPARESSWVRAGGLGPARLAPVDVAKAIQRFEPVSVIARPQDAAEAGRLLGRAISVVALAVNDTWLRDTGPTFLIDDTGRLAAADWQFIRPVAKMRGIPKSGAP